MTLTIALFLAAGFLFIMTEHLVAGVAIILGVATLAVQWFCIDPPETDTNDGSDEGNNEGG